jgi:hypothetical protein
MERTLKLHKEKNPAMQRIADMLTTAFNDIGENTPAFETIGK